MTSPASAAPPILLLVDDDDDLAAAFTKSLVRGGYVVRRARTGTEAIGLAAAEPRIDAAIVDMVLPGVGGLEVVKAVRAGHPKCRIVAVTGLHAPFLDGAFRGAGADAFLTKPVERTDLFAALGNSPS